MKKSQIIEHQATGEAWYVTYDSEGNEKKRYNLITDTAKWSPAKPSDICPEYMLRYCQAKGIDDLRWYVSIVTGDYTKNETLSDGKTIKTSVTRKRTPTEVRQAFVSKYFPKLNEKRPPITHSQKAEQLLAAEEARHNKNVAEPKQKKEASPKEEK